MEHKRYWRSLAELEATAQERAAEAPEFPVGADLPDGASGLSRRGFLQLAGASLALAGAAGCSKAPADQILPYTLAPVGLTPGLPQYYATSMVLDGFATGLLVESHEGRPTKVEGNPDHPASLGATGVFEQASVLSLYDPQRARVLKRPGGAALWGDLQAPFAASRADHGARLRFLLQPGSSPLVGEWLARLRARHPEARFTFYSPGSPGYSQSGAQLVFGRPLAVHYDLSQAQVVLALDSDFLSAGPFAVRYARQFADRRRVTKPTDDMNRLYAVESMMTPTGSTADHRLRVKPSEVVAIAAALLVELGVPGLDPALLSRLSAPAAGLAHKFVRAVAKDLRANAGRSVVIAGETQPPEVHALALLVNGALGNLGKAVSTTEPVLIDAGPATQDLSALSAELAAGRVETLVIVDGNPAYDAPSDLGFAGHLRAVPNSLYYGLYDNETARACGWFAPASHYLESWGDARACDGTLSLVQPLIAPLFDTRTETELLASLAGEPHPTAHALLRDSFARRALPWERHLQKGFVVDSAFTPVSVAPAPATVLSGALSVALERRGASGPGVELSFLLDSRVYDGRFANNAWLQELPRPLTKLTWDNAALLSPRTAARLGCGNQQVLEIALGERHVRLPALIVPGHADETISLALGYGRKGGELHAGAGVNVYPLRTVAQPFFAAGATVQATAERRVLAITQQHWSMQGRDEILTGTLAGYRQNPDFTRGHKGPQPSLMAPRVESSTQAVEQWAMTIDNSVCIGCGACELACQAENNILVVGKAAVNDGREMHWLRIDTYYTGDLDNPQVAHEPMLCQHCEHAPCEYVCPVNATVHSPDGLNEMVYNRCVGTRFCSNNCPYKVRRFNFFKWEERQPANQGLVALQRNPEVTVRQRGVMEKCSYCVQRIRGVEIHAHNEHRAMRTGEVQTACQQVCPSRAIQFDSLTHADSEMARNRKQPRIYSVLHELGTRPRTQYLAKLFNPNPDLS